MRASSRSSSTPRALTVAGSGATSVPSSSRVGVTNLERGIAALAELGVEASEPVTLDVGTGEWRYASFRDPDDLYVSLVEPRY